MSTADDTDISDTAVTKVHPGRLIFLLIASSSGMAGTERVSRTADILLSVPEVISDPPVPVTRLTGEVEISGGVFEDQDSSAELTGRTVVSVTLRIPLRP